MSVTLVLPTPLDIVEQHHHLRVPRSLAQLECGPRANGTDEDEVIMEYRYGTPFCRTLRKPRRQSALYRRLAGSIALMLTLTHRPYARGRRP